MARKIHRLSAKTIAAIREPGYYPDGGNLYLQVSRWGTKSWIFRYMRGKSRDMGLGPLHTVSLADARNKATACRRLLLDGLDPLEAREARRALQSLQDAKAITFKQCAEDYIEQNKSGWKNAKHTEQWGNTLETYVYPEFGPVPVQAVDTALVLRALKPIWTAKHETATRVRARIETVLDAAKALGYREGDNPARWKGHLDKLLPAIEKRKRVKHHAALPFVEVAAFLKSLAEQEGVAPQALQFTILTATRTGDVIGALWNEIDWQQAVWTIPASRMKSGREHRVPLSGSAVKVLKAMELLRQDAHVFPGFRKDVAMSNMAMLKVLERMKRSDITVHGFRSTFRDWTAERTNYPRDVCEMALAHVIGDRTEAAYRRGDLFDKRRRLMSDWAKFCSHADGNIVSLERKRA